MESQILKQIPEEKRDELRLKLAEWAWKKKNSPIDVEGVPEEQREETLRELNLWYAKKRGIELVNEKAEELQGTSKKQVEAAKNSMIAKQLISGRTAW